MTQSPIIPVVLSGGDGVRLWPLSRHSRPKQFIDLSSDGSTFSKTLERIKDGMFSHPFIVCNKDQKFLVAEECRKGNIECQSIITEPVARNTAPAIAAAAMSILGNNLNNSNSLMLVLPSDHIIGDLEGFYDSIKRSRTMAESGYLVTLGIKPTRPEIGYGYIKIGDPIMGLENCHSVEQFVEKPDLQLATAFKSSGDYFWNSGIFLFSPEGYLDQLKKFHPEIIDTVSTALAAANADTFFVDLEERSFELSPALSIDVAVMEKTDVASVCEVEMGWTDIGSWVTISEMNVANNDGNVFVGDILAHDTKNSYIHSDRHLIGTIGVQDLVVAAVDDSILVATKDQVHNVREIVDQLKLLGRHEHIHHSKVYRPWGYYQNLLVGNNFLVKEICIEKGKRISLQYHHYRTESWFVVEGKASIRNGDNEEVLNSGESTYIPAGVIHRLENQEDQILRIIEVQFGEHLSEEDIIRLEDDFGRQ